MTSLKDIAKRAGVNISTVSRAMNGSSEISEETRKRVEKIAAELNYTPDFTARALAGKRTNLIGVILPEITSSYYTQVISNVETILGESGYSMILGTTGFDYNNEVRYLNIFKNRKVDGIILIGSMFKEIEPYLVKAGMNNNMPFVLVETFVDYPQYDYIMIDNSYGINLAISHLKALGHEKVGFLSEEISFKQRLSGFKEALERNSLRFDHRFVKVGKERFEAGGYLRMKELLAGEELPTAIFASYDSMAIGAMKAAAEAGLGIPRDISVVGFDNIRESEYLTVPLSTVSSPVKEMARLGVKLLLDKIEHPLNHVVQHVSLKPGLVVRSSTMSPP